MTAIKHPLLDLVYNEETGRYIAHLEHKVVHLTLEDCRMRSLLELLTGQMWSDENFKTKSDEDLQKIAIDVLKRRLQLSDEDAVKLVLQRWDGLNPPVPGQQGQPQVFAGPNPNMPHPHIVALSRPLPYTGPKYDVEKHLQGMERNAKNHEAHRRAHGVQ